MVNLADGEFGGWRILSLLLWYCRLDNVTSCLACLHAQLIVDTYTRSCIHFPSNDGGR